MEKIDELKQLRINYKKNSDELYRRFKKDLDELTKTFIEMLENIKDR